MRLGGGSRKGSSFERKMARELSQWWYGRPDLLWRRSGNEVRVKQPTLHTGDVVPLGNEPLPYLWIFHVQLKHWKAGAFNWHTMLSDYYKSRVRAIWVEALKARRKDLVSLLIVKENNRPLLCFFHEFAVNSRAINGDCVRFPDGLVCMPWGAAQGLLLDLRFDSRGKRG